ncbi:MAG: EAL domain-containing protein [Frankiaceae bacterium]|nr:EAL domain-containing protein [Frankiaceae bacterium]
MTGPGPELAVQDVLDALVAATCAVGSDGVIVAVNDAWRSFAHDNGGDPAVVGINANYLATCEQAGTCADAADHQSEDAADAADAIDVARGLRDVLSGTTALHRHTYPCHHGEVQRWFTVAIAPLPTLDGLGALIIHTDVTLLRRTERALTHQAQHDRLTGLPNRALLDDRLAQALADARRNGNHVCVAFLDLDHFKRINDSLGHAGGDALLVEVAARLQSAVREVDTLARYAGDEFVVVWADLATREEVGPLGARLARTLELPVEVSGTLVQISASIGVATALPGQTGEEVLLAADAAMYDAKRRGRGRIRLFTGELRAGVQERMATELDLRAALGRCELVLHYQPVVDLRTGRPVAGEALARWQHPRRGVLGPDQFIAVAEETGLIVPLGQWALAQACQDAVDPGGPLAGLDVAVNLSVRQLADPDIIRHVRTALVASGLEPHRLLLEVTESAVVEDEPAAALALEELAALGVRLAIDDFGTGWSSLLYLRRYPISTIKIDRVFVAGIGRSHDDEAICASVVSLAQAVGATCIAEGVETEQQAAALLGYGCHQGQGFLWSKAVPVDELGAVLTTCVDVTPESTAPQGRRRRRDCDPLDDAVAGRIALLHGAGASLHTIAGALNAEHRQHPAGGRWSAAAVARYLAAA